MPPLFHYFFVLPVRPTAPARHDTLRHRQVTIRPEVKVEPVSRCVRVCPQTFFASSDLLFPYKCHQFIGIQLTQSSSFRPHRVRKGAAYPFVSNPEDYAVVVRPPYRPWCRLSKTIPTAYPRCARQPREAKIYDAFTVPGLECWRAADFIAREVESNCKLLQHLPSRTIRYPRPDSGIKFAGHRKVGMGTVCTLPPMLQASSRITRSSGSAGGSTRKRQSYRPSFLRIPSPALPPLRTTSPCLSGSAGHGPIVIRQLTNKQQVHLPFFRCLESKLSAIIVLFRFT